MPDFAQRFTFRPAVALPAALRAELDALLARFGPDCARVECIAAPVPGIKSGRSTYLARLRDGTLAKLHWLESADEAARLAELRARVALPWLAHLSAHGPLLAEAWIDGDVLTATEAEARAEELGALLGSLHAALPPDAPSHVDTHARARRARDDLACIAETGQLPRAGCEALAAALAASDPGRARSVLVHKDFRPDNLVVKADGSLHLFDNEWLDVGASASDLALTAVRWPVGAETWRRFRRGYTRNAPHAPEAERFWQIAMAARAVIIRRHAPPAARARPLDMLRVLADGGVPA